MTMNDAQKIYSYLISEGYTRETNTLNMTVLGNWTIRQNVDTGEKLSTFIQKFPQMFVLANRNRSIYAVVPPGQSIASQYPYTWRREDFQGTYDSPPFDKDVNVAALRRPSPPPSDDDLLLQSTSQRIGGKSKSKSRSAKKSKSKSRNARKSRTKKNRNRRNKTARKY